MNYNIKLFAAIKRSGLSQKEFARIIGEQPSTVSRVINGWFNLNDHGKAKYAHFLGCDVEEIFPDA
ncbi:putative DNA-binding protein, lambda repressor-like [Desulfosarcina variabilis str. Montpellier]|uniref:helix-turn-helix domain-containing protein n=1 Tax=Desulfosarcina variabilis TaxID=2300 RepID=UPI003AFA470B